MLPVSGLSFMSIKICSVLIVLLPDLCFMLLLLRVYVRVCACVCVCACMFACVCMCVCVCVGVILRPVMHSNVSR